MPSLCGVPTLVLCVLEQDGDSVMGTQRVVGASRAAPTYNQRGDWSPRTSKCEGGAGENKEPTVNSLRSREQRIPRPISRVPGALQRQDGGNPVGIVRKLPPS